MSTSMLSPPHSATHAIRVALIGTLATVLGGVACTREAKEPVDATSADGGKTTPAAPQPATAQPAAPASAPVAAPVESSDTKSDVQKRFDAFVAERNACNSTADCTLVSPGCPLGCGTGVRSEHADAVSTKAAALIAEAEQERGACAYRCAALHVECVEARCTALVE